MVTEKIDAVPQRPGVEEQTLENQNPHLPEMFFVSSHVDLFSSPGFWAGLACTPLLSALLKGFLDKQLSKLSELQHVSFELIRCSFNDCTKSHGRRQYHVLIFATPIPLPQ